MEGNPPPSFMLRLLLSLCLIIGISSCSFLRDSPGGRALLKGDSIYSHGYEFHNVLALKVIPAPDNSIAIKFIKNNKEYTCFNSGCVAIIVSKE